MSTSEEYGSGENFAIQLATMAFIGAVTIVILIPLFQDVIAIFGNVTASTTTGNGVFSEEYALLLAAGRAALALFPLVSMGSSIAVAYTKLGIPGAVGYQILSASAIGMLAGSPLAVVWFIAGTGGLAVVSLLKERSGRRSHPTARRL
jgi:hypothetical protein